MGKGLNRARNKQADMAKKMQLAKTQKDLNNTLLSPSTEDLYLSQVPPIEEEEEHAIFAQLLAKHQPPAPRAEITTFQPDIERETSPSRKKESKSGPKIKAKDVKRRKKKVKENRICNSSGLVDLPLQQGDSAERVHFESIYSWKSNQPLGAMLAAQLVPWVPPFLQDSLIVLADPRQRSFELRQAIQYLQSNLASSTLQRVIVICADPPPKIPKPVDIDTSSIQVFSDFKLKWMRKYSAVVDDDRWSMAMLVFDQDAIIRKIVRNVDPAEICALVMDADEEFRN